MKKISKTAVAFGAFMGTFLIFYLIACAIFPVNEENILQAPDWYKTIGAITSCLMAVLVVLVYSRSEKKWSAQPFPWDMPQQQTPYTHQMGMPTPPPGMRLPPPPSADMGMGYAYQSSTSSAAKTQKVIVARKESTASAGKTYTILLDGTPVASLPNGGIATFMSSPGRHKIAFKGYLRIENFTDVVIGGSPNPTRLYAKINPSTGKISVEDATGSAFDSLFAGKPPIPIRGPSKKSKKPHPVRQVFQRSPSLAAIDKMEGHEFERFTADLLRKLGYERVEVTPGSGDQGVDVIAVKDGKRYAIQCKRYAQKLGNKPIQEVHAGKTIYGCSVAAVITNNYFTDGGKEAARALGVELWDRDELRKMIEFAEYRAIG